MQKRTFEVVMKRRGFLKAALGAILAPSLPLPKLATKVIRPSIVPAVLMIPPTFKQINLVMHEFTVKTWVSRELMADSPVQLESYLSRIPCRE